ncbi:arylsulfatase A-like enzyme [Mariniflexile fucanivorans]|uniref:Arylsulfatase A-like enzyme n=1 Tax=Mariniflexile fucanivorans TaxID=264023 RepID=A0A4R1RJ89_9FLAO|nr:arylsulfatase [Mariniflexile fucanivorans]TCL66201.1 arylsulfatase A-like enzyme [Mariniflexile fucanivorans]
MHYKKTFLIFCVISIWSQLCFAQVNQELPNIVLINADDLGYGDLGCYGATKLATPNIDKLAKEGRMFTDAHSASSVCTPSRYALLTGEYPIRKGGLDSPIFLKDKLVIDTKKETMASLLKKAGYSTACIGKWHLGFGTTKPVDWNKPLAPGPNELGFDYYYGVPVVNSHPPFVYVENHNVVGLTEDDPFVYGKKAKTKEIFEKMNLDDIGGADKAHALYVDEQVGTHLKEKALGWMKEQKDKPFFLYFATTNIHHPFTPAPQFIGTSQSGLYGDFVHELDWIVGEVMNTLKEMGVAENTLVIFTSDNGGMFNATGQKAWKQGHKMNGELLGFKFDAWEGGNRIPFITHWPNKIKAGEVSNQLICNVDMLATIAELTGQELEKGQGQDSKNMLAAITGQTNKQIRNEVLLAPKNSSHLAIRKGNWLYIGAKGGGGFNSAKEGSHGFGGPAAISFAGEINSDIENGKMKKDAPPAQLYNLEEDISQTTNLYLQYPDVVKDMQISLDKYKEGSKE